MRINTNIAALNSYNQLKNTQNNLSKSLQRLSSGKRINGAADDAAGLAISEKMNAQVRGLGQAQRNAQDGISMIQTAEGALKESHSILQRMRELAVQSANDTNTSADRAEIQKEVDQLSQELSRIGETTEFNTQKLLNGTVDEMKFQIGANDSQNMSVSINDMQGHALGATGDVKTTETATPSANVDFSEGTYTVEEGSDGEYDMYNSDGILMAQSSDGKSWTSESAGETLDFTIGAVTSGEVTISSGGDATAEVGVENLGLEAGTYTYDDSSSELIDANGNVVGEDSGTPGTFLDAGGNDVVTFGGALSDGQTVEVGGVDISGQSAANDAISTLDEALAKVSEERSKLGSVQNRLDHTINNLNTAQENLTAAESRISDVDMAQEMMSFTKNQILSQAGTAMMAQANQLPQGVLQLLG